MSYRRVHGVRSALARMIMPPPGNHGLRRRASGRAPAEDEVGTEVDAEIEFHLEMRAAELVECGIASADAQAEAKRRFGDVGRWRAAIAAVDRARAARQRRAAWLQHLRQDVRDGARALRRAPRFALAAVLTLALGIGAATAVFGVVKSVLVDPLPYADVDRLVRVDGRMPNGATKDGVPDDGVSERASLSAGTVADIATRQRAFTRLAAFMTGTPGAVYDGGDGPRLVPVTAAEPALFPTLGVAAALGRTFTERDARPDTGRAVLLTHEAWRRLFAANPRVIGRAVRLDGVARTVVGVLPRSFVGPAGAVDFYLPLSLGPALRDPVTARGSRWLGLVGRLAPGVTPEAARHDLARIAADRVREDPSDAGADDVAAVPMRDALAGGVRAPLLLLAVGAGLVLLVTWAHLAGALLPRARAWELAGGAPARAGQGRLVRPMAIQSTLLALAGGALGVGLAAVGLRALPGPALPVLPSYAHPVLDRGVVLVAATLTLVTGLVGVLPAFRIAFATDEPRADRLRWAFVAGKLAVCVSLLASAGLLARSQRAMTAPPLGFAPDGVLTVAIQLPAGKYRSAEARWWIYRRLEERLRALPGVTAVASVSEPPTTVGEHMAVVVEGAPSAADDVPGRVLFASVSDDYFHTLGIPVRQGRGFGEQDRADGLPAVVVSETLARRYWPRGGALGSQIRIGPDPHAAPATVVGIVGDVRNDPARPQAEPMAYVASRQGPWGSVSLLLRTRGDPLLLLAPVRREFASLDPELPDARVTTLRALVTEAFAEHRLPSAPMLTFGALALALASAGAYTAFAAAAARGRGVRGRVVRRDGAIPFASPALAVARRAVQDGGPWVLAGLAGGGAVTLGIGVPRDLRVGTQLLDPAALGAAIAVPLACSFLALWVAVRRATTRQPARRWNHLLGDTDDTFDALA